MRELKLPPPPPGMPGAFSLSDANHLERTFAQAGFVQVHIEPLMLTLELASAGDYVRFQQAIVMQFNALLARYPAEEQAKVWQAITEAARAYTAQDDLCRMENEFLLAAGRREG